MGVTHFLILSKTETAPYLRVARTPQGPTLTFKIQEYSLAVDVAHSQVRPRCPQDLFKNPPLVIIFFWGVHAQIYTSVQLRVYIVATDFHLIASYGNFANLRSIAPVFSWQWPERYHKWVPNFQLLEGLCFSNSYHWECYHEQPLKSSLDVSLESVISFFCHVNHVIVLLCCDQGYVLTQKSLWFGAPKWIPVLFMYNFTVFPH